MGATWLPEVDGWSRSLTPIGLSTQRPSSRGPLLGEGDTAAAEGDTAADGGVCPNEQPAISSSGISGKARRIPLNIICGHSGVAQWWSRRLLTARLSVRVRPPEPPFLNTNRWALTFGAPMARGHLVTRMVT